MKFTLHNYQEKAVSDVLDALDEARSRYDRKNNTTAVSLTAVTGAGKTVMATGVLEALLHGNDQGTEPDPELTVLWLTDDPSLNEQTRRKMLVSSDLIAPKQLVTIGDDNLLDQELLNAGTVYFLNIHKLGKGATNYTETGDRRRYSLWDTIRHTIRTRGSSFLLVIDEAHRGTSGGRNGSRKSIATQLISGDPTHGVPPSPVVLGISATPERFNDAVSGSGRLLHPVEVDVDEVRKSGLIKDLVSISFPTETQPGDATLIEQAVSDVITFYGKWSEYTSSRDLADVEPVLVVQVRAGTSDNDLAAVVETIRAAWDDLDDRAIAHSFQEHTRLDLGSHTVRYVAPQDIQDDPHLRVVLFKEALTTGWDCPRAEVMVSLRSASDHTYIAQLIGRMIRTPLARRVPSSELLNSVSLYLPHFDADSVNQVITGLRAGDDQIAAEVTRSAVLCKRSPDVPDDVWAAAESIPTYTRPSKTHRNEIARLNSFAQLLASADIDKQAPKKARAHVVATMKREAGRLGEALDAEVQQLATLEYRTRTVTTFDTGSGDIVAERARDVSTRNIDDLFRQARRTFGDAAATWYWDAICAEQEESDGEGDPQVAKLQVAALSRDPASVEATQKAAAELIATLRAEHNAAIGKLSDDDRGRIYAIFQQSRQPEQITLTLPDDINVNAPTGTKRHDKHLYINGGKRFPADVNDWEQAVLDSRLPGAVAWYRNPTAGSRAVAVPYTVGTDQRTMYPDFVFFRETDDAVVIDLVDPHDPSRSDTAPKWAGLAAYAAKHKDVLGEVLAVIKSSDDDQMWSLDLRDPNVKTKLESASSEAAIRQVFRDHGGKL